MIKQHSIRVVNTSSFKANLATVGKSCPWALRELFFSLNHDILSNSSCNVCIMQTLQTALSSALRNCDSFLELHTRDAVFRMVWKSEMPSDLLCRCYPSELSPDSLYGNFSAQSPSPIAELIINGPDGDKRHSKDLEISSGWLFSWASDWASIVPYDLPYLYHRVPDTRV